MKLLIPILFILTTISPTFAAPGEMDIIKEGEPAKYDGFTIDDERAQYFRQINEERKLAEEKSAKQEQLAKINETETQYYKDNYLETKKELEKQESKKTFIMVGAFVGGILTTLGIGYVILLALP